MSGVWKGFVSECWYDDNLLQGSLLWVSLYDIDWQFGFWRGLLTIMCNKINIYKDSNCLFVRCRFCDGYIPVKFDPDYNESKISIEGVCKTCKTKIYVYTSKDNFKMIKGSIDSEP